MPLNFTQNHRKLPLGTRVCEICGKEGILEYMYAMGAVWHVTGHFMIQSFTCQTEPTAQHWGCSPEHAMQALAHCLQHDEHLSVNLMKSKHLDAKNMGLSKIAPEHIAIAQEYGDNFHFDFIRDLKNGIK